MANSCCAIWAVAAIGIAFFAFLAITAIAMAWASRKENNK